MCGKQEECVATRQSALSAAPRLCMSHITAIDFLGSVRIRQQAATAKQHAGQELPRQMEHLV